MQNHPWFERKKNFQAEKRPPCAFKRSMLLFFHKKMQDEGQEWMCMREQIAVYELLRDIIRGKTGHLSRVTFTPQKPAFPFSEEIKQPFPRTTPEKQGISSRMLSDFFRDLAALQHTDIHQVMVLRNGAVIGECGYAPYRKEIWHIGHSLCKSITGMAIGFLIGEGRLSLDDKVVKILESKKSLLAGMRQKNLTIEHLLTMSSGVNFRETGIVTGDDWVKGYLDASVTESPGTKFDYNSMNSYMLSAIVTEITGEPMDQYLMPRLFEPLGIEKFFWEACPKGITKGGWGLFLCPEDAAKLGQLYLDQGRWKGNQIVDEAWVRESVSRKMDTPAKMSDWGYGYQIWMGGRPGSFLFNGMLGQNVIVYPDLNMVIVTNAGSNELFVKSKLMDVIQSYFAKDFDPPATLPENPVAYDGLLRTCRCLETVREVHPAKERGGWGSGKRGRRPRGLRSQTQMCRLNGAFYRLERQQAGLFPLIMQVFHNNFTDGISSIGFQYEGGRSFLLIKAGALSKRLEIGFSKAVINEISIHGEPYLTAVKGSFTSDEEDRMVLKLDIAFLEEAARRKLKIFFEGEEIWIRFDETPGKELIETGLGEMLKEVTSNPLLNGIREMSPMDIPELLLEQTVSPVIRGSLVTGKTKEERE